MSKVYAALEEFLITAIFLLSLALLGYGMYAVLEWFVGILNPLF